MLKNLANRVIWQVNRSPLQRPIKAAVSLAHAGEVRRRKALARTITVDPALAACADLLNQSGHCLLSTLVDPDLLTALALAGQEKLQATNAGTVRQGQNHKAFWTRLLDQDMTDGKLPVDNPFVQFAIQPAVAQVLIHALGQVPRLDYVLLTLSAFTGKPLSVSQLWHRDHDDVRVIKLFAYLTAVEDERDGPFTFLPGPVSDQYGYARRSHRSDAEIFGRGPATPADVRSLVAPALSIFLVDTSRCLHMGSRLSEGHQRLLYTASFTTVPSIYPNRPQRFHADAPPKTELDRALLDL